MTLGYRLGYRLITLSSHRCVRVLFLVVSVIAVFYGVYSVYNVNFEIGKLEDPSKFFDYASCGDDQ